MEKIFAKSLELSRALFPVTVAEREGRRCVHFSYLFDKTRLICMGENQNRSHPVNRFNLRNFDISQKNICSECQLFLKTKSKFDKLNWKKLTIVNVRINLNGKICNSHPCPACENLISYVNPRRLYYSNDSGGFTKF